MLRIVNALIIAAGSGIIVLAGSPTAAANECPTGYYWSKSHGNCVEKPDTNPAGATAECADGLYSHSETPNADENCSGHGGVAQECPCGSAAGQSSVVSDADSVYVAYLNNYGTPFIDTPETRQALRSFGVDHVCDPLNNGDTASQVAQPLLDQGDTRYAAQTDMTGAVLAYCPSYLGAVNAYWRSS